METKILTFNGVKLTLVEHPKLGWGVPARILGWALGYANEGQKLADHIKKYNEHESFAAHDLGASKVFVLGEEDCYTLAGDELAEFKNAAGLQGSKASGLLFLTMTGVRKILLRSRAKAAKALRVYLAESGGPAVAGLGLALMSPRIPGSDAMSPRNPGSVESTKPMDEFKRLLSWMKKEGYGTQEQREAYAFRAVEQFLGQLNPTSSAPTTVPLALPAGIKFAVTGLPLEGDHPDFPGWLTAAEIAKPYGKTGNHFARIISEYCASLGTKLPNVQAKAAAMAHSGQLPVDERGYCVFVVPKVQGYARWGTNTNGMSLWINVWSPDAVKAIRRRYEDKMVESGAPVYAQASFPILGPDAKS